MSPTILVIDDMADIRLSAYFLLSNHHYQVLEAESPQQALDMLKQQSVDLIILDMNYSTDTTSGKEGLDFLKRLTKEGFAIPVVAMTGWSSIDLAVQAMQNGAADFIEKPWDNQRLLQIVKQQLQVSNLKKQNLSLRQLNKTLENDGMLQGSTAKEELIFHSTAMKKLMVDITRLAKTNATILLTGENGTGKSSIAKAIHQASNRQSNSFVTVNMGAIPESLFESEMFGHKKGAFTDAKESRIGRFELAQQGTLFLDEIANIPLSQQAKLLRVLESNEYEMVGSSLTQTADIRLISASNGDFESLIQQNDFRPDLFYRLNTIELHVPALRDRLEDIMPLATFFIAKHSRRYACKIMILASDVEEKLIHYSWPGNIRELSHVMERAVLLSSSNTLTADDIQLRSTTVKQNNKQSDKIPFMKLEDAEQQLLGDALQKTNGSAADAAELLGISKSAIYRRLEKFGMGTS
jgi:DNA-binding NtrC family response regulator